MVIELILRWCVLSDLTAAGIAEGDEVTVVVGLRGDAIAPPGRLGIVQLSSGVPQRNRLFENDEALNPEREAGISPVNSFVVTLKSCKSERFNVGMVPVNWLSSSLSVSRRVNRLTSGGIAPEKLLCEMSRR